MALPPEIANGLYINGLGGLTAAPATRPCGRDHSQITGANVTRCEAWYNCNHLQLPGQRRPAFQMSNTNPYNFLFVSNIQGGVAVGIMPRRPGNTHVYSDNYGGCEWHILARNDGSAAAFLHVYKGGGNTADYAMAGGWTQRGVVQSAPVAAQVGLGGNIVSYAYVAGGTNTAECCMLVLNNQGMITGIHQYQAVNIG